MKNNLFFSCFITFMMSGCVTQPPAPIEYNHDKNSTIKPITKQSISKKYLENDENVIINREMAEQEKDFDHPTGFLREPNIKEDDRIIVPKIKPDNDKIIYHQVQQGETLESIANDYSNNTEELAELNEISPPYNLEESQIIKIKVSSEILNKKNRENIARKRQNVEQDNEQKFIRPVNGKIITKFGEQTSKGTSKGVDIATDEGNIVQSIASGVVVFAGKDARFGNLLIIKLDNSNLFIAYAHLQDLITQKGQAVKKGEVIGHIGHTGDVKSPQLHFAIREGQIAVDPLKYVNYTN